MLPMCARSMQIWVRLWSVSSPVQVQRDHCGHLSRMYKWVTFLNSVWLKSGSAVPSKVQRRADSRLRLSEWRAGAHCPGIGEDTMDDDQQASSTTEVQLVKMVIVSSRSTSDPMQSDLTRPQSLGGRILSVSAKRRPIIFESRVTDSYKMGSILTSSGTKVNIELGDAETQRS
jgi:hypothetical protein